MFKYLKTKISGNMKFNKKIVIFSVGYFFVFVCILVLQSFLPMSKIDSCSNDISNLSLKSSTESSLIYFKPKALFDVESPESKIEGFNRNNDSNLQNVAYKNFIGTNFDKKTITIPSLEDKNPVILMSTRLSEYTLEDSDEKFYYSGIKLLGLSHGSNKNSYFCYITTKQADYIINNSSGKYNSYEDLIGESLDFNISGFNGNETFPYYIQDIIISDEGKDNRYNELFGSYIYCYYLTFQKSTGLSFAFDMGSDINQNSKILTDNLNLYSLDKYDVSLLSNTDSKLQNKIIKNLVDSMANSNLTVWFIILEFVFIMVYVFTIFSFVQKDNSYSILLALILCGIFFLFYNLLLLLNLLKINFVSIFFNPFTNIIEFALIALTISAIFISTFVKEKPSKFPREDK